jgi:REP element-mobilizing transposase RayT
MARPLRIEYDGALYHLTSRGNDRKAIFKNDGDRKLFLDTLAQVIKRFHWICHTYCLMNNHYHLIVETPEPWLDFDQQHVATVASVEGVFQLLDGDKKIL